MTRSEGRTARTVGSTIKDPPYHEVRMPNDCSLSIMVPRLSRRALVCYQSIQRFNRSGAE